jgi:hypothetical protein
MKQLCNPENHTGGEAHYAHRSSFDWVMVGNTVGWFCEDCRLDIEKLQEEEYEKTDSQ